MTLMAVRNWGKLLALVEVNYCRLFDLHCPLHPIFTTSVPPFPIYQLAKLPLLQALVVAVHAVFCNGKRESITQKRQNNYPTMVDMFYANLKEGIARLSRGQWWPVIGDQFDETWSSPLHPRLFQTLMQRDRRIKRLIIHWLCWNHQDHLRSSR